MRTQLGLYIGLLLAASLHSPGYSQTVGREFVKLDLVDGHNDKRVVSRNHGAVNFLNCYSTDSRGYHFRPMINQALLYPDPIGDRLGYDTCGLFDVDGDGFNDWAETWYHAEPVDALTGIPRLDVNKTSVLPTLVDDVANAGIFESHTPTSVRQAPSERVGFCRVISGATGHQLGDDLWGSLDNCRFAHEIARIGDLDGDERGEVVFASNTADSGRGSINIYSFSSKYNTDTNDETERWVCIMKIVGDAPTSELGYELSDFFPDLNGDGTPDIIAASVWWRDPSLLNRDSYDESYRWVYRKDRGGAWVFLMPRADVFTFNQHSGSPLPGDPRVVAPLVIYESDASLTIHNPVASGSRRFPLADLDFAGDIDGDNIPDLVVNAGFTVSSTVETRGEFVFLSHDGYANSLGRDNGTLKDAKPVLVMGSYWPDRPEDFRQLDLNTDMADFVIAGDSNHSFEYNIPSVFGREFDYNPAASNNSSADMVLLASEMEPHGPAIVEQDGVLVTTPIATPSPSNVRMMLDLPSRFGEGGTFRSVIDASHATPIVWTHNQLPGGADYIFQTTRDTTPNFASTDPCATVRVFEGHNIVGVNMAGNFNGDGGGDCELILDTVTSETNAFHLGAQNNNDYFNRGYCLVVDIPPAAPCNNRALPEILYEIQGESETVDPGAPLRDTDFSSWLDVRPNYQGCIGEPGWDQDGDGKSDVIVRAPFLPRLVEKVPSLPTDLEQPCTPIDAATDGRVQPYLVDGGADYLVLSPAALPTIDSVSAPVFGPGHLVTFTIIGHNLVPEAMPFTFWNKDKVLYKSSPGAATGIAAFSVVAERVPQRHPDNRAQIVGNTTTLTITFNSEGLRGELLAPLISTRCIELPTRWVDDVSKRPLCVPVPGFVEVSEEPLP